MIMMMIMKTIMNMMLAMITIMMMVMLMMMTRMMMTSMMLMMTNTSHYSGRRGVAKLTGVSYTVDVDLNAGPSQHSVNGSHVVLLHVVQEH